MWQKLKANNIWNRKRTENKKVFGPKVFNRTFKELKHFCVSMFFALLQQLSQPSKHQISKHRKICKAKTCLPGWQWDGGLLSSFANRWFASGPALQAFLGRMSFVSFLPFEWKIEAMTRLSSINYTAGCWISGSCCVPVSQNRLPETQCFTRTKAENTKEIMALWKHPVTMEAWGSFLCFTSPSCCLLFLLEIGC